MFVPFDFFRGTGLMFVLEVIAFFPPFFAGTIKGFCGESISIWIVASLYNAVAQQSTIHQTPL